MQHKTIAFIGDSIGRQQFQSLMCMATGGEDSSEVENVGERMDLSNFLKQLGLMTLLTGSQTPTPPFYITGHQAFRI
jgi:hypothetical protein